jgi:uncharacterized membrane protein
LPLAWRARGLILRSAGKFARFFSVGELIMADYENGAPVQTKTLSSNMLLITHAIYGIFAFSAISAASIVGLLVSFIGFVGVILAHVFRDDAQGTWLKSHFDWLIKTFWVSFLIGIVGWVFFFTIIGIVVAFPLWAVLFVWTAYRLIRGWINLFREKPVG